MNRLQHLLAGRGPGKVQGHASGGSLGGLRAPGLRRRGDGACRLSSVELHVTAENGRGKQVPRPSQPQFGLIGTRVCLRVGLC